MTVQSEYRKLRGPLFSPAYGIHQPRALECLRLARERAWMRDHWTDTDEGAESDDGRLRFRLVPDYEMPDPGDTFDIAMHKDTVPGGERSIKAQEKEWRERVERDGAWGYIVERKCPACGRWDHVDSCWGFDDAAYCRDEAISAAYYEAHK